MHRLVRDQLLEERRRCLPGDAAQRQQPDIEHRRELCLELAFEIAEPGVDARDAKQIGAQVDEELHSAFESGEQAQQSIRGRSQRVAEASLGTSTIVAALQRTDRVVDGRGIGPEVAREHEQQVEATVVGQRDVRVGDRSRLGPLRHRVVQQEQIGDDFAQA